MADPTTVAALVAAASEIGWVGKTGQNREQGYNFRGIDAILKHVAPAFRKHGIVVTPTVLSAEDEEIVSGRGTRGHRVTMLVRFDFMISGGETVSAVTRGEGMDYADKASNKAMSQAFKYALVQTLALPTDEPDADEVTPEPAYQPAKRLGEQLTELVGDRDEARMWAKVGAKQLGIQLNRLNDKKVDQILAWAKSRKEEGAPVTSDELEKGDTDGEGASSEDE